MRARGRLSVDCFASREAEEVLGESGLLPMRRQWPHVVAIDRIVGIDRRCRLSREGWQLFTW